MLNRSDLVFPTCSDIFNMRLIEIIWKRENFLIVKGVRENEERFHTSLRLSEEKQD